jgi:hypothetical protein
MPWIYVFKPAWVGAAALQEWVTCSSPSSEQPLPAADTRWHAVPAAAGCTVVLVLVLVRPSAWTWTLNASHAPLKRWRQRQHS